MIGPVRRQRPPFAHLPKNYDVSRDSNLPRIFTVKLIRKSPFPRLHGDTRIFSWKNLKNSKNSAEY